ncbi:MAG: hypothetical protein J5817_12075 [Treponema sp.]|nr:hypothetical protein [Treponema sp.]
MKKVFLLAALCLLFTSCGFLLALDDAFSEDVSLTIENDAERKVKISYIDHDSDPELPVTVEPGSSRKINFSERRGSFIVRFVYASITYEDSVYLSDGNSTYNIYLDSNSRLKVKLDGGRGYSPPRRL